MERGLALLDLGRAAAAVKVFEQLLRLERDYPDLLPWLVKARSVLARKQAAGTQEWQQALAPGEVEADRIKLVAAMQRSSMTSAGINSESLQEVTVGVDHYTFLGVSVDFTETELKKAYKSMSVPSNCGALVALTVSQCCTRLLQEQENAPRS